VSAFRNVLRYFGLAEEPDPEVSSEPWPVGDPIATLERLRSEARPVPLTDEVRFDRQRANEAIEELRRQTLGTAGSSEPLDQLHDLVENAKPVPLTDEVRVNRDELGRRVDAVLAVQL